MNEPKTETSLKDLFPLISAEWEKARLAYNVPELPPEVQAKLGDQLQSGMVALGKLQAKLTLLLSDAGKSILEGRAGVIETQWERDGKAPVSPEILQVMAMADLALETVKKFCGLAEREVNSYLLRETLQVSSSMDTVVAYFPWTGIGYPIQVHEGDEVGVATAGENGQVHLRIPEGYKSVTLDYENHSATWNP